MNSSISLEKLRKNVRKAFRIIPVGIFQLVDIAADRHPCVGAEREAQLGLIQPQRLKVESVAEKRTREKKVAYY